MQRSLAHAASASIARGVNPRYLILLLSAVGVCAGAVAITVIPYGRSFWDFLFILDGAYRIGLGQVPHVDFASPIGSLTLYLTYLAERLVPGGQPFVGLHALMWLLLLPALTMLAGRFRNGLHFGAAVALSAIVVLLPYTLDRTTLSEISYFAIYNRFATGVLFLLGLWYVLPKRRWDGLLLAYLLALLFFLKVTSAAVAVGLLIAAVLLRRATLRPVALGIAGFAAFCGAVDVGSGLVSGYLRDILFMGTVNQGGMAHHVAYALYANWVPLAVGAGVFGLAVWSALPLRHAWPRWRHATARFLSIEAFALDAVILLGVALAAESQNTGGVGLVAASALFFHPDVQGQRSWRLVGTTLLAATLVFPLLETDVFRTITGFNRDRIGSSDHPFSALVPGVRVSTATLEGAKLLRRVSQEWLDLEYEVQANHFFIDTDPASTSPAAQAAWSEDVVDAAQVFRAKGLAATAHRYATVAFTNPFPRLLGLTPAQGTPLVLELGRTIPVFGPEEGARYLGDADGVFVTRCVLSNGGVTLRTVFQPVLDAQFEPVPLNPCWDFYHRKT